MDNHPVSGTTPCAPKSKTRLNQAIRTLLKHPLYGNYRFDTFGQVIVRPDGTASDDRFDPVEAAVWLGSQKLSVLPGMARHALAWIAHAQAFDSLVEHLEGLPEWDGQSRLDTWLIDWLGVEDNERIRRVGRMFLVSAMARAFEPGCQVDHVLVLHGARQGEGKSAVVRLLGGPFTREMTCSVTDKDAKLQLQGAWFVEFADLGSLPRSEINAVKGFISQPVDNYRPPYQSQTLSFPRRSIFVVTTNELDFLRDPSGARRFWPVTCNFTEKNSNLSPEAKKHMRNQLLSEAKRAFFDGEKWWLYPGDGALWESVQEAESELQQEDDAWLDVIAAYVADRAEITTAEVLEKVIKLHRSEQTRVHMMRAGACLKQLNFKRFRVGAHRIADTSTVKWVCEGEEAG